ncbi:MAG: SurA N-terminal domain-containing protein [Pseudomonadota bacterium]
MMESLKKWASGWVAFVMIGLLILSFAIWGVADVFTGYGAGNVAAVGDETISEEEFQQAFQNQLAMIARQAQRRVTLEEAKAFGLDSRVLNGLIEASAVQAHAKELELSLSDQTLAAGLKQDPTFQGTDGKFYRPLVDATMRQLGVSEQGLLQLRRNDELREHIATAMLRATVVPDAMVDAIHAYRQEKRTVSHFKMDPDKVLDVKDPTETDLKGFFEARKSQYMTPQRRTFSALVLTRNALKVKAPVSEEQIKAYFEQNKARYDTPERRVLQQISFDDEAAARKAKEEIDGGKNFVDVASALGATDKDINLGLREKSQLIDPAIAEAAFALEDGSVSDPVKGRFATVLLRVLSIVDGVDSKLEDVRDRVKDELADAWARDQLRTLYDAVDEGRLAARSLKDIGEETGIGHFLVEDADQRNQKPDKSLALDVVDADRIVGAAYGAEIGLEQEPVELSDGGFAWVDLQSVAKPRQRTFAEAEADVKIQWLADERRKQLQDAAKGFVDRIAAGEDMAKVAEEAGGTVVQSAPATRSETPDGLTAAAIAQAFVLAKGRAGSSEIDNGKSRVVFRLDAIEKAGAPDKEQRTVIRNELRQQFRRDQFATYISSLRARFGVDVNQSAIDRVTGLGGRIGG